MSATKLLATGVLNWWRAERITDRYGAVTIETEQGFFTEFEEAPIDVRGRLVAHVLVARESTHIGDLFHGFRPSLPAVGERIPLGCGTLFVDKDEADGGPAIGLEPDDKRETFWLDPKALYRAHEQTVELWFEEEAPDGE